MKYLYGYRMNEVPDIALPECKESLKVSRCYTPRAEFRSLRVPRSRSLPLCFTRATPPRPCSGCPASMAGGMRKRFGGKTPTVNRGVKRKFIKFVKLWLKKNMVSLTDSDIPDFEGWLERAPYTQARKVELTRTWDKVHRKAVLARFRRVKSFIKDETYPDWKYPRLINSRVDEAKCYFGPVVQAVSDALFSRPEFIKKIPVAERPLFIRNLLESSGVDSDYTFTDYTAFEAHFTPEVMQMTQILLFRHMLKDTSYSGEWMDMYTTVMTGKNQLAFKHLSATLVATRMSGEMDTSLSNGFANLMLFEFVCFLRNCKCVGIVEGDDGLFRCSPARNAPTAQDFADLGFTIKIEHTRTLSEASFCGQVYDMNDLVVVTDPLEVLARVGWTNKQYVKCNERTAMQLLRAKAYSLVYQYHGCPMLDALGRRLLDLTVGVTIDQRIFDNLDQWEKEKLKNAVNNIPDPVDVKPNTRQLVEKLYGVTETQQLSFEEECKTLEFGFHPLPCSDQVPESWRTYYNVYSSDIYTVDPAWLLKSDRSYLKRLAQVPNFVNFVRSIC